MHPSLASGLLVYHPRGEAPSLVVQQRFLLVLGNLQPSEPFLSDGQIVVDILKAHFRRALWALHLDPAHSSTRSFFNDDARLVHQRPLWYTIMPRSLCEAAFTQSHILGGEPLSAGAVQALFSNPLSLFCIHSYLACCILGDNHASADEALSRPFPCTQSVAEDFVSAKAPLPSCRASSLAILSGGEAAFRHLNGLMALLLLAVVLCFQLEELEDRLKVLPLVHVVAYYYRLHDEFDLSFRQVTKWIVCNAPKPQCAFHIPRHGVVADEHLLQRDIAQGTRLAVLMRDVWRQFLDANSDVDRGRHLSSLLALARNYYNAESSAELGCTLVGTYFVNLSQNWFEHLLRLTCIPPTECVSVVDILSVSAMECPDGKDVADFLGGSVGQVLDLMAGYHVALAAAILPIGNFRTYSTGADWSLAQTRFFLYAHRQYGEPQLSSIAAASSGCSSRDDGSNSSSSSSSRLGSDPAPLSLRSIWLAFDCLVIAVCITQTGRWTKQSGQRPDRWTTENVGNLFGLVLLRSAGAMKSLEVAVLHQGGGRSAERSSMRAPPRGPHDAKAVVLSNLQIASAYMDACTSGQAMPRSAPSRCPLSSSITFPQWVRAAEQIAGRWTPTGIFYTLVPDFYSIDPAHMDYPGMREKKKKQGF